MSFLEINGILNEAQFGFHRQKSTKMAAFELVFEIIQSLEQSRIPLGVFCDFSKAFDCVSHELLLTKSKYYRSKGDSIDYFRNYLCERFQRVKIIGGNGIPHFF